MLADWSVECGADDPVLDVPWSSSDALHDPDALPNPDTPRNSAGMARFIDLRENPYDLDHIVEAEQHPALLQALRALNANRSPVFTAKCDAWAQDAEECEALRIDLNLMEPEAPCGFTSYIDMIWRERTIFVSFHQQEQRLVRLARLLQPLDHPYAAADCVLRPAMVDLTGPQEGFAVSLYIKALGTDPAHAYEHWAAALDAVVAVVRGREFSLT